MAMKAVSGIGIGMALSCLFVLSIADGAAGAVAFSNDWQYVEVLILGDGEILESAQNHFNTGGDAELDEEAIYWGYAYGRSQLKTVYESNRLTVDGRVFLDVYPAWDFDEVSANAHVYYQTHITVIDEPVWLKISGYLTPSQNHIPKDHFAVGSPVWFWWTNDGSGNKVWMFDTAMFEAGDHVIYGGIDYTLTAAWGGYEDALYADYYFSVEIVDPPVFEPSQADLNGDGRVNLADLALFAGAWLWEQ